MEKEAISIYSKEFQKNHQEALRRLEKLNGPSDIKRIQTIISENEQCIRLMEHDVVNVSFSSFKAEKEKLKQMKLQLIDLKKQLKLKANTQDHKANNQFLFGDGALGNPGNSKAGLLDDQYGNQDQDIYAKQNQKLVETKKRGYQAEIFGHNAQGELARQDMMFDKTDHGTQKIYGSTTESRKLLKEIEKRKKQSDMVVYAALAGVAVSVGIIGIVKIFRIFRSIFG